MSVFQCILLTLFIIASSGMIYGFYHLIKLEIKIKNRKYKASDPLAYDKYIDNINRKQN